MIISVEKSNHIKMETEIFQVLNEQEEERGAIECPYKKFKFDSDEDNADASFVTKVENSKEGDNSNGDNDGIHQESLQAGKTPFDGLDETGDVGSENGEQKIKLRGLNDAITLESL